MHGANQIDHAVHTLGNHGPSAYSRAIAWDMLLDGVPQFSTSKLQWWILSFVNMVLVQGPLTLRLHCSELTVNIIQDVLPEGMDS
jgi:hypothetical protein